MTKISPDRWRSFAKALSDFENTVHGDSPRDEAFEVIAEGRALLRAAEMTGEAPKILDVKPLTIEEADVWLPPEKPKPVKTPPVETKTRRDQSKKIGYTEDPCPNCGEFKLRRKGTCTSCDACAWDTGCG
jgi:predicted RNA-binding Zn-ribbon protein involved in translation (DUF1610 family)